MAHTIGLAVSLTPQGRVRVAPGEGEPEVEASLAERIRSAFAQGTGHGLLHLGAAEPTTVLPPTLRFWRDLGADFVQRLCRLPDAAAASPNVPCPREELPGRVLCAPPMRGGELLDTDLLLRLWGAMQDALGAATEGGGVQVWLQAQHPAWNLVGRVHFHLAEKKGDSDAPFAFLATYTTRLAADGRVQHQPLGRAVRAWSASGASEALLALLTPVHRAATRCAWVEERVSSGELFHPMRWTAAEALEFLDQVPELEAAGILLRVPAAWRAGRPQRPRVTTTVGSRRPSVLGLDALLDFRVGLTLDGEALTPEEIESLLAGTRSLALLRGRWVEVDPDRLRRIMDQLQTAQTAAERDGLRFSEAMRLLAGVPAGDEADDDRAPQWSEVVSGPWLSEALAALRTQPGAGAEAEAEADPELTATLRPYQRAGVRWLTLLTRLGLGACLADDMGLGKTIQVLALLLRLRRERPGRARLLVVPASLLGNWSAEAARFAPSLRLEVLHSSALPPRRLAALGPADLAETDLVMTTYGSVRRLAWLSEVEWDVVILDEAQAIKNPGARQTRAVKALRAAARIALTGTPVENRLSDLWSLFDFINPGLLGTAAEFRALTRRLANRRETPYAPLRALVQPYILRRLKTDRRVLRDLPGKTEMKAWCGLGKKQLALYEQTVQDLTRALAQAKEEPSIRRRGLVLASLTRLKQICNHPSQWLGDGVWDPADSGKMHRLAELVEVVASRQEKVLVFTQFRELTGPLVRFLGDAFGRVGLVLHGGTPVKRRKERVDRFQEDEDVPFLVLSLRAGGTGLNLTAANHVIHFDRWWNPAVEDQATDRAFRIGQTRNVLVHKLICRGTVEERIDAMIESKRALSRELVGGGGGHALLTEMPDDELLRTVALDIHRARDES